MHNRRKKLVWEIPNKSQQQQHKKNFFSHKILIVNMHIKITFRIFFLIIVFYILYSVTSSVKNETSERKNM